MKPEVPPVSRGDGTVTLMFFFLCLSYTDKRGEREVRAFSSLKAAEHGMGDSFDEMITELMRPSATTSALLARLASRPPEKLVVTPSVARRLDKRFFPPLPGRLFTLLAPLPGKALAVYMVLRLRSRLDKVQTVTLTSAYLRQDRITSDQKERALACLEAAHLITVDRTTGKNPQVTLRVEDVPWVR